MMFVCLYSVLLYCANGLWAFAYGHLHFGHLHMGIYISGICIWAFTFRAFAYCIWAFTFRAFAYGHLHFSGICIWAFSDFYWGTPFATNHQPVPAHSGDGGSATAEPGAESGEAGFICPSSSTRWGALGVVYLLHFSPCRPGAARPYSGSSPVRRR